MLDSAGDVVADEAHAFEAVDAAFGGFVGVPDFDRCVVDGFDVGVAAEDDDPVEGSDEVVGELSGCLFGDVDTDLEKGLGGESVDGDARFGAGGVDVDAVVKR